MKILNSNLCDISADITHNLSDNPSEHAKKKYLKAIPILLNSL